MASPLRLRLPPPLLFSLFQRLVIACRVRPGPESSRLEILNVLKSAKTLSPKTLSQSKEVPGDVSLGILLTLQPATDDIIK